MADLREVQDFKDLLKVNKHSLDEELEQQGDILWRISEHKAAASTTLNLAKDHLANVEAKLAYQVRVDWSEKGGADSRLTVGEVAGIVQRHADRKQAFKQYQEARQQFDRWEGLYEAWKQRGFSLKTLAELYVANYFVANSAGSNRSDSRISNRRHEEGRERLNEARQQQRVGKKRHLV